MFTGLLEVIDGTKAKLHPHKNNVERARAVIESLPDQRPTHVGDEMDAENENSH